MPRAGVAATAAATATATASTPTSIRRSVVSGDDRPTVEGPPMPRSRGPSQGKLLGALQRNGLMRSIRPSSTADDRREDTNQDLMLQQAPVDLLPAEVRRITAEFNAKCAAGITMTTSQQLSNFVISLGIELTFEAVINSVIAELFDPAREVVTLDLVLQVVSKVKNAYTAVRRALDKEAAAGADSTPSATLMFKSLVDSATMTVPVAALRDALLAAGMCVDLNQVRDRAHVPQTDSIGRDHFFAIMKVIDADFRASTVTEWDDGSDEERFDVFDDDDDLDEADCAPHVQAKRLQAAISPKRRAGQLEPRKAKRRSGASHSKSMVELVAQARERERQLAEERARKQREATRITGADGLTDFQRRRLLKSFRMTQPLTDMYGTKQLFRKSSAMPSEDNAVLQMLFEPLRTDANDDSPIANDIERDGPPRARSSMALGSRKATMVSGPQFQSFTRKQSRFAASESQDDNAPFLRAGPISGLLRRRMQSYSSSVLRDGDENASSWLQGANAVSIAVECSDRNAGSDGRRAGSIRFDVSSRDGRGASFNPDIEVSSPRSPTVFTEGDDVVTLRVRVSSTTVTPSTTTMALASQPRSKTRRVPPPTDVIVGDSAVTIANHARGTATVLKLPRLRRHPAEGTPARADFGDRLHGDGAKDWAVNYADFMR